MRNHDENRKLHNEMMKYLVNGVGSSFHKSEVEDMPVCAKYGKGSKMYDVDGNEYIDYVLGFGPMILGHVNKKVDDAVIAQLRKGTHFSAPTEELGAFAKRLVEIIPCADKVVFQSTGSEADMYAFRLARAYTGRMKMIKFEGHYHGWADEQNINFAAKSIDDFGPLDNPNKIYNVKGQRHATSDDVVLAPWNDLETLEIIIKRHDGEIAGIIMEPYMCDEGPIAPQPGYLEGVRKLCDKYGIVLIFDEIITGFRLSLSGAQGAFGVIPDLALYAKALGGGYPISMICGKKEIMDVGVTASGCFNGNPIACTAGLVVLEELSKPGVYEQFQKIGDMIADGMKELGKKHGIKVYSDAIGAICTIMFGVDRPVKDIRDYVANADVDMYNKFFLMTKELGVRLSYRRGRLFLSTEHTEEDVQRTLDIFDEALFNILK